MVGKSFLEWASETGLGDQIYEARFARGISQERLGALSGCGGGHINNIELGRVMPNGNTIVRISKALDSVFVLGPGHAEICSKTELLKKPKRRDRQVHRQEYPPPDTLFVWWTAKQVAARYGISPRWARERLRLLGVPRKRGLGAPGNARVWYRQVDVERAMGGSE